jgi:AsmA protein
LVDGAISSRDLAVDLGKNRLSLQLKTSNLDKKPIAIGLSASGDSIDLDTATAAEKGGNDTTHPAPTPGKEAGPLNLPATANGSVRVASIKYRGLVLSGLSLRYRLADNILNVDDVKGSVAGGNFTDSTRINLAVPGFSYNTRLSLNGVQVGKLADAFAPKSKGSVSGVLSARADISGLGTLPASMKRNLTGSGDFDIRNGVLSGAGFVSGLARFLGSEELRIIRFTSFNGRYRIGGEQILLDSEVNGSDIRMKPKGRIGFDKSLDMDIDTRIAPRHTGKVARGTVGSFVTDEQGWGVLPLKASGTVGSPRFSLSARGIGRQLKEKAGDVIRKKLFRKEGAGSQESPLEKSIKGLFGN